MNHEPRRPKESARGRAWLAALLLPCAAAAGVARAGVVGQAVPESFSLCEATRIGTEEPRPGCEASDVRFQADPATAATDFGFAVAAGHLNDDDREDLVVGDPVRNRVYVFFGRRSVTQAYGLDPAVFSDREVPVESQADVVLIGSAGTSFGFSVAVGRERSTGDCPDGGTAAALAIGAPGTPGAATAPGTVFWVAPGALCRTPANPPQRADIDVRTIAQAVRAPVVENDEFGYAVAFGRLLSTGGTEEDLIVGARTAAGGAGVVTAFPVDAGVVSTALGDVVRIEGSAGDGLGEVLAVGDLDLDFDIDEEPRGDRDDLAIGAVGHETGKLLLVQGPLDPDGGRDSDGIYRETDDEVAVVLGEQPGDFFGFSVAISAQGLLAVGAVFADNVPPAQEGPGGDPKTNVLGGERVNAGKAYVWTSGVFKQDLQERGAVTADQVYVARRSGDQLGFSVGFGDLDDTGSDDLLLAARREDGKALTADEIDQGTVYVVYNATFVTSPIDLGRCAASSDCTGVGGTDVLIFGGDRGADVGDEIGFAMAIGDFNGDLADEMFVSSRTHHRVYAVTLLDSDDDRETQGRNLRDDDDDEDGDADSIDCGPLDPEINSGAEEIPCNTIDENCNGDADDTPDADGDGFDACGSENTARDCDDDDPLSFPDAAERCDGNDNDCSGSVPVEEQDPDGDGWVTCADWDDTQGDHPDIQGGGDCAAGDAATFPGAAPLDDPAACMTDADGDDWGDDTPRAGVTAGTDCDDGSAVTFPGAAPNEPVAGACMEDEDGDGWGDSRPRAGVTPGTDCADKDANSFPGAPERCDGDDNACRGAVPANETDVDGDRYVACSGWNDTQGNQPTILGGGDCDETDAMTFPGAAPREANPAACRRDRDGDDWGDLNPPATVTRGTDCDDASATTFPGAAQIEGPLNCMKDTDDDGYGDDSVALPVVAGTDCDDDDATSFRGAAEVPDDGIDQDCNGFDTVTCFVDADRDGFGGETPKLSADGDCDDDGESPVDTDCDDADDRISPDAAEVPDDGIDQDCNGFDTVTCIVDADRDGFGTALGTTRLADDGSCDTAQQESRSSDDCDDADPASFPGAPERCDGNDNACAGSLPDNERDVDGDGWVVCTDWNDTQGDNPRIKGGGDCNDTSPFTFPGAAPNEGAGSACMKDADGDDWGDQVPPMGVTPGTDCDDSSAATFPGAAQIEAPLNCMRDVDDDGWGDKTAVLPVVRGSDCNDRDPTSFPGAAERCDGNDNDCNGVVPPGEVDVDGDRYVACAGWNDTQGDNPAILGGGDCDETDADTFPGSAPRETFAGACMRDKDGDDYGDQRPPAGVTRGTDCDDASAVTFPGAAQIEAPLNCMKDADDDGWGDDRAVLPVVRGRDCDDADPLRNPGVNEGPDGDPVCSDGIDNDCDALTDLDDPGCVPLEPCPDGDLDGYADCATQPCDDSGLTCGDCDDGDPNLNPGEAELCDEVDNDCDGAVDEDFDLDGDGFTTCELPVADCDDGDPAVNPAADEVCGDGIDNDCDPATLDLQDADGDGAACDVDCDDADPALNLDDADLDSFSTCDGDCDDTDDAVNPGAAEVCADGIDNDCDPTTLDFQDGDGDGYFCDVDCDDADPALNLDDADQDGFTSCAGDCNDAEPGINPDATEVCDGIDNDCDGTVDEEFDLDGDGFSNCTDPPDCNDGDPDVNPGAPEVCNDGVDNDCNPGTVDRFDGDADGTFCDTDCDDADPTSFPGAAEVCDGNDNDCDGVLPPGEIDGDLDGYVACAGWDDTQGDDPAVAGGGDCDPNDADTFPGSAPNESFANACMRDKDGDDYGDQSPPVEGVTPGTDCDDASAATFPGAAEIEAPLNCMRDADDDGWGDENAVLPVVPGSDCDDAEPATFPGAEEICGDGIDQDCDGVDPPCPVAGPRTGPRLLPRWREPGPRIRDPETLRPEATQRPEATPRPVAGAGRGAVDAWVWGPGRGLFFLVLPADGAAPAPRTRRGERP